ncbi:desumoylating isopeptidase 1 [Quercus suber]|uniref:Desumoylating isopeptidase 1 n=1 Tax=Quercus suber TaxID=58331 RepID=A0AAW0M7S6_QUESU
MNVFLGGHDLLWSYGRMIFIYSLHNRHTGVVVYGNEYYFGGGIQHAPAGSTPYGTPIRMVDLGVTHVSKDVVEMYLQEISPRYTAETYSLLTHNCNNFSNEVAQFLVGHDLLWSYGRMIFIYSLHNRHTGVVVYGNEYYFGGGIQHAPAGSTPYGTPIRMVDLGVTHVSKDVVEMYLQEISPRYTAETYSLLTHNCNNFSNEVAQFLTSSFLNLKQKRISYLLSPSLYFKPPPVGEFSFSTVVFTALTVRVEGDEPLGSKYPLVLNLWVLLIVSMLPMIQNLEPTLKAGAVPQVPQFRPSVAQPSQPVTTAKSEAPSKSEDPKTTKNAVLAAVNPAGEQQKLVVNGVEGDPHGKARSKVQEEIGNEFAAIMATESLR